jgi:hypothetical protein
MCKLKSSTDYADYTDFISTVNRLSLFSKSLCYRRNLWMISWF